MSFLLECLLDLLPLCKRSCQILIHKSNVLVHSALSSGNTLRLQVLQPSKASVHTIIAQFPSTTSINLSGDPHQSCKASVQHQPSLY